ncbi:MAG: vitamin K epoxide reductase family protein [Candidatus Gastranaerophilales bacterium]|nr:vitamin K epoxide reductase family protein [Candidatus Gastranaerophilales bacterium]
MDEKETRDLVLKKIFIIFFAVVGFFTTVKLAIIYYDTNFNPYALPSFCSVNQFIDCDGVAQTTHSQFFGVPLACWGLGLYLFIIFLVFVDKLQQIEFLGFLKVFKNPLEYICALGFISFAISMILAGISIFEIKKICILCVFTYFLNLFIAIVAADLNKSLLESFKVSIKDFIDAIKVKKYLFSLIVVMLLAGSFLTYTSLTYCFAPQVKRHKEFKKYEKMQNDSPFKATGNILGDTDGKFTAYIYTDYRCPICRTYNVIINRAAQELGGFKIVHKNMPLDMACNKYLSKPFHEGSCTLAKYSIAAENQGRFWDVNSEFFEKQPGNEKEALKLIESMGFNMPKFKKDIESDATNERLYSDIENAAELKIDGTPTIVINGKVYAGIKPYYELRDILIKAGAFEREGK